MRQVPEDFKLDGALLEWARAQGFTFHLEREFQSCLDWHRSRNMKRKDWPATIRHWFTKAQQFIDARQPPPRGTRRYREDDF